MSNDQTATHTDSQIEADLRALGEASDRGEVLNIQEPAGNQDTEAAAETSTTEGKTDTQQQTGAAPASTEKKPADATTATDPAKPKQESEYSRFQKDKERLGKNWQVLQQERLEINRAREELQRLRNHEPVRLKHEQTAAAIEQKSPLAKYSDDQLHEAAEVYETSGDEKHARIVRDELAHRRENAAQSQRGEQITDQRQHQDAQQQAQEQFVGTWKTHLTNVTTENPDLSKPDSDLYKETAAVLKEFPYFSTVNNGIVGAVQAAKLRLEARAAPELRKRIAEHEKELTQLRKATSPGGGTTETRGSSQKPFEQMTENEQLAYMTSQAAEVDAA